MFTLRGSVFIGASFTLVITGFLRVDGVLITLGAVGLLVTLISLVAGRWNLAGLNLRLTAPKRVFADTPIDLRLSVANRKSLFGSCHLDLKISLGRCAPLFTRAPWTACRSASSVKLRGRIPERGVMTTHPCVISSSFPLGLLRFRRHIEIQHEMLVYPRAIVPREFFANGQFDDSTDGSGDQSGQAPGEPRGLRPFQAGDRAKQIHWPATIRALSRGRSPRVREFDPPGLRPRKAVVLFHSYGTDHTLIRTDLFERALALACGTLRHLRGAGIPTQFIADFLSWKPQATFHPEGWSETLAVLTHAHRADQTEAHDLTAEIESIPRETALIIISDMPPEVWKHTLPDRPAMLVDIHQHRFGNRDLKVARPLTRRVS